MPGQPLLTVAYSTLAARTHRISLAGFDHDHEVLMCVQGGSLSADGELTRARVISVPGTGVAKSRNASIEHGRGRYLLFCDDDVTVNLPGVAEGIRHLQRTGHALALGQAVDPSGAARKKYPRSVTPLTPFNSAKAATYEILIDLAQVRASGVRFDLRFGAGTDLHLGDEYIFIVDLLRAGLSCDAVPAVFGTHPPVSSGTVWGGREDSHARAVALNRVFGRWAVLARTAFALKNRTKLRDWRTFMAFVTDNAQPPLPQSVRRLRIPAAPAAVFGPGVRMSEQPGQAKLAALAEASRLMPESLAVQEVGATVADNVLEPPRG